MNETNRKLRAVHPVGKGQEAFRECKPQIDLLVRHGHAGDRSEAQGIIEKSVAALSKHGTPKVIPAGEKIYEQYSEADSVALLRNGQVSACDVAEDGRRRIIRIHNGITILGDEALREEEADRLRDYTAEARTNCIIIPLERNRMSKVIREHPEVGIFMSVSLLSNLHRQQGQMVEMIRLDAISRIKHVLNRLFSDNPQGINMKMGDIAEQAWTTRESVSRTTIELKNKGKIQYAYGKGRRTYFVLSNKKTPGRS